MVLVKKKNGQLRVCIDYRKLNKCTEKDHFPLPFVNTILEEVAGYELYTFINGYSDTIKSLYTPMIITRLPLLHHGEPLFT